MKRKDLKLLLDPSRATHHILLGGGEGGCINSFRLVLYEEPQVTQMGTCTGKCD